MKTQECNHGIHFDPEEAEGMTAWEIRHKWPRRFGECPKGCGAIGILYASELHYHMGDW